MHKHLDARVLVEKRTADGVEQKEPAAAESPRIHRRGQRTSERAWTQWRGRDWRSWTGRKGTQTAGQGERRNQNRGQRDPGTWRRKLAGGRFNWNRAERAEQGVGDYIGRARNVDNVTGKFRDVGKRRTMAERSGKGRG